MQTNHLPILTILESLKHNFLKNKKTEKKSLGRKILKIIAWFLGILLILFFLLVLFIRSPWGQNIIVQRAVKYVSEKTNSDVAIEKLFITFRGNVMLKGLYLSDAKGDTLVYSKSLEASVPILPLLRKNTVGVDYLKWEGLKASVYRKDSIEGYNFQFLIDAFASDESDSIEKDTTSSSPRIIIGDVFFSDFDLQFDDAVMGIDARLDLGNLAFRMKKTDLEKMDFRAAEISLSNSRAYFKQTKNTPKTEEENDTPLPFLQVDKLALNNVFVDFISEPNRIAANLEIGDFLIELKKGDLEANKFEVGNLNLKNSVVILHTQTETNGVTETAEDVKEEARKDIQKFEWPDLELAVSKIDFQQNHIGYFVADAKVETGIFNANALDLTDLDLLMNDIYLKDKKGGLVLDKFSFKEGSGLDLRKLETEILATDEKIEIAKLDLKLNNNILEGMAEITYPSLADFIEKPEDARLSIDFPKFHLDVRDAYRFQPDLKKNEYVRALARKSVDGKLKASGYLASIDIPVLDIRWGKSTAIVAHGTIKNATNPDFLGFNIPYFSARSTRADLIQFIDEEELGVNLPENIVFKGNARGNLNDIVANAELNTTQGIALVKGYFKNDTRISFDADLVVKEYRLDELLENEQLGPLSLQIKTSGSGNNMNTLDANLDATISNFEMRDYQIRDWNIRGEIIQGIGDISSAYKDNNVDLDFLAEVELDSVSPKVSAHLNLKGANLQSLGLMSRDVRTGLKLDVDFEGAKGGFDIISTIGDGVVIQDEKTYLLGDVLATAHVRQDTTSIWIDNKILQLSLESNAEPGAFGKAVQRHIGSYFSRKIEVADTAANPVKLKVIGRVAQAPVLNQVFLKNVRDLDTIKLAAYFDERERILAARINAPHIDYGGSTLDSLKFSMDTNKEKFIFDLGFENIQAGPLDIPETHITGEQIQDEMRLRFRAIHNDSILTNIKTKISGTAEELSLTVQEDSLILNKHRWKIPETNEIVLYPNSVTFEDFKFSHLDESFELTDKLTHIAQEHAAVQFDNFKLNEILDYLNPNEELAKGVVNGNLALLNPFNDLGILANLNVNQLEMLNVDLGTLSINANSEKNDTYNFDVALKEGEVDLDVKGNYLGAQEGEINANIFLNEFRMTALEGFSMGEIRNASGSASGRFRINGAVSDPQYKGNLNFANAGFTVSQLNSSFTLLNENILIDNSGVTFRRFSILDENKNELVINGKVGTVEMTDPTFDLDIYAKNFQFVNAGEDDNDFLHGKAAFDAQGTISGDLNVPKVNLKLTIDDNTKLTYILPSSTVAMEERDGIVMFMNREDPEAVLTRTQQQKAKITGFDLNALLKIGKEAKIGIIINQETGDNFQIYGDGDLNFIMNPNGNMSLTGIYDVAGGHYEMNLYGLVNRKFELVSGSKVSWAGDPMDAALNIRAMYKVETSASPLMAPVSSGSDPSERGKFRQVLPFYVYLNVDGDLDKPEVSFDLDMPEDDQGAIGGQVYGRLQQVNQQEGELNRQVFSLLVMNRFYPEPGSDGSEGGFTSIARDNINDALSDQLNAFSNKLLGKSGFELDFGLDSYTDYQGESPQERTQLNIAAQKKLFDDRLIVRVGSEVDIDGGGSRDEPTPIIGNVSLEYYLTENGRYRLKGFRKNSFENVIDGQTIVSGLAVIFTQEFNEFNELWQAILHGETDKEKEQRRAEERRKRIKERQLERKERRAKNKGRRLKQEIKTTEEE